jgi:hypothetical protein
MSLTDSAAAFKARAKALQVSEAGIKSQCGIQIPLLAFMCADNVSLCDDPTVCQLI